MVNKHFQMISMNSLVVVSCMQFLRIQIKSQNLRVLFKVVPIPLLEHQYSSYRSCMGIFGLMEGRRQEIKRGGGNIPPSSPPPSSPPPLLSFPLPFIKLPKEGK